MLTPRLSARIGLSRSAANARPHGERSSHHSSAASTIVDDQHEVEEREVAVERMPSSDGRGMPEMPKVPPVSLSSLRITR